MTKPCKIADSVHGVITLSGYERDVMSTIAFNRLHDVYQNSVVYLTFPCNRTKRFEHSLGTMKVCSDMFVSAIAGTPKDTLCVFLDAFAAEIYGIKSSILDDGETREAMFGDTTGEITVDVEDYISSLVPLWAFVEGGVPNQEESLKRLTTCAILLQSIRAAAMLHDIGHPPFSHVVEGGISELYTKSLNKLDISGWREFHSLLEVYFGKGALHEQMGLVISSDVLKQVAVSGNSKQNGLHGTTLYRLIIKSCVERIFEEREGDIFSDLHRIIDSCVDGDRLDYVSRDPLNSGLDVGLVNYKRIIQGMRIFDIGDCGVDDSDNGIIERFIFSFPVKATGSIENFLQRRFELYHDIVFHHRSMLMSNLLRSAVVGLAEMELDASGSNSSKNVGMDAIRRSFTIPHSIQGLWYPLKRGLGTLERSRGLSQWDDSWLTSALRHTFYTHFYPKRGDLKDDSLYICLAELLNSKKAHYSLIKRCEDFRIFDRAAKEAIRSQTGVLMDSIAAAYPLLDDDEAALVLDEVMNEQLGEEALMPEMSYDWALLSDCYSIIDVCDDENRMLYPMVVNRSTSLVDPEELKSFTSLEGFHSEGVRAKKLFEKSVRERLIDSLMNETKTLTANDIIFDFSSPGIGIGKHEVFLHNELGDVYFLRSVSGIQDRLQNQLDNMPGFWAFVRLPSEWRHPSKKHQLLKAAGNAFGGLVVDCLLSRLDSVVAEDEDMEKVDA